MDYLHDIERRLDNNEPLFDNIINNNGIMLYTIVDKDGTIPMSVSNMCVCKYTTSSTMYICMYMLSQYLRF